MIHFRDLPGQRRRGTKAFAEAPRDNNPKPAQPPAPSRPDPADTSQQVPGPIPWRTYSPGYRERDPIVFGGPRYWETSGKETGT